MEEKEKKLNSNLAYREMKPLIVTFPLSLMFFFSCGSGHPDKRVTAENAFEGVNKYCHDVYDWSAAFTWWMYLVLFTSIHEVVLLYRILNLTSRIIEA